MSNIFALVDSNSIVQQVIVLDDVSCGGKKFPESEPDGQAYISNTLCLKGVWKQASTSGDFRVRYPSRGMYYDKVKDAFYWKENPRPDIFVWDPVKLDWVDPNA
jgi:hypothetical protein